MSLKLAMSKYVTAQQRKMEGFGRCPVSPGKGGEWGIFLVF